MGTIRAHPRAALAIGTRADVLYVHEMASRSSILPYLRRTPLLWIGVLLLLPGLVFGTIGVAVAIQDARFAADGVTAEGTVLSKDIKHATGSSSTSYSIRYQFTASNDQAYEGSSSIDVHDWERLVERGPVTVEYLSADPSSNRIPGSGALLLGVLFLAIGAALVPFGGYFVWRESRTLREDRRLLRVGTEARATVAAVEPTSVRVNWNLQWVISYTYRVGGKGYEGRSWMMPEVEARRYSPGDHAAIRYDPDRPAQSLWMHERAAGGSERVQDP